VYFEDGSLPIGSLGPHWSHQPRSRLPFELHDDAADIGGVGNPEKDSTLDDIKVGVVLVRVVEVYLDEHDDGWVLSFYVK
jgi:hypothetical protein